MDILAFILIGGIWAAFLLPRFFETRRSAPMSTTRNFARTTALLASVSSNGQELLQRRRAIRRRRRILLGLAAAASLSLTIAIMRGSVAWLIATLTIDVAIALYVAMLVHVRQQQLTSARVVEMPAAASAPHKERDGVRVVAG